MNKIEQKNIGMTFVPKYQDRFNRRRHTTKNKTGRDQL